MKKTYVFRKISSRTLSLSDSLWETAEKVLLDCYNMNEKEGYPETSVRGVWSDDGISLKFETDETPVLARFDKYGDPAYRDSCVEFSSIPTLPDLINISILSFPQAADCWSECGKTVPIKPRRRVI